MRIECSSSSSEVLPVAFENPQGEQCVVVYSKGAHEIEVRGIKAGKHRVVVTDAERRGAEVESQTVREGGPLTFLFSGQGLVTFAARQGKPAVPETPAYSRRYKLAFSTYFGGRGTETPREIRFDSAGNIAAATLTESLASDFPKAIRIGPLGGGEMGYDVLVAKLTSDGSRLLWMTLIGGSEKDYVTYNGGWSDTYAVKISPDGTRLIYATYLGGGAENHEHRMWLDSDGNVYLAGATTSSDFPVVNAYQSAYGGGDSDGYLVKLDPDGKPVFSTYIGGSGSDGASGPAIDGTGNVFVYGETHSSDFEVTPNSYQSSLVDGKGDTYLRIYDSKGQLVYSTFFGGKDWDRGTYVALDSSGNPVVLGEISSPDLPTTAGVYDRTYTGNRDGFIAKFSSITR